MCVQTLSAPTALSALPTQSTSSPPSLTAPTAHRLHSSAIVPTWPPLVRVSAIVPTGPPLVRVFKSLRSVPKLPPSPPPPPSALRPPPTATLTAPTAHCLHSSAIVPTWPPLVRVFRSLRSIQRLPIVPKPPPLHRPHRPGSGLCHCPHLAALGSGFQVFKKYLEASNVSPNSLRPHRPRRPHHLERFVHTAPTLRRHHLHPHCPHRSPPSLLCHCPHLAAVGPGFQVFKKYLEASNVCPNPSALTAPTALSASSCPHFTSLPPSLTAPTAHRLHSSAIVPTWPPLVRVFRSLRSI